MKRKFVIFLILSAVTVGILGFWNWQKNSFSKEILKLEILGPAKTSLGQEIEYIVKYKNNGDFRLENPELIFEPPSYALKLGGEEIFERQVLNSKDLGEAIYPGEEKISSFKMRLLGKEGEVKIVKASLSYQLKNLKTKYESPTFFTTVIESVPLTFEFDLPSKVESGKNFIFRINYFSNVDYSLSDLRCQIDYPLGFEFVESTPKSLDKADWEIPILNKSQGGRIEITGKILGEVSEAKIFKAKLGIWKDGEFILLKEIEKGMEIIKPSIYLRQEINGNPQYTAFPGDWLHYEIYFKNIGDDDLNSLFMVNKLEGEAFDFQTIKSDLGASQQGDNSVVFDWRRVPKLQYLAPMEEGKIDFWIKLKDDLGMVKNPILKNKVFVNEVKEEFVTKISSKLEIVQKGYFQDEVFGNTGPFPPKVGEKTTYTIMWQVKNYYSDVKETKVKATLPQGVELTGTIFPEEEVPKFAYDSQSREIVWSTGDLKMGQGILGPGPNISFQIAFTPQESQRGQTPEIISEAKITGEDSWTDRIIEAASKGINTTLPDDKTITEGTGKIQ